MALLPPAVLTVEIPEYFRPSQLAYVDRCALRVVGLEQSVSRLPGGPEALRGRLAHDFLDAAARYAPADRSPDRLRTELLRRLEVLEEDLQRNSADSGFARLEETVAPLEWRNFVHRLVRIASRVPAVSTDGAARASSEAMASAAPSSNNRLRHGLWTELPMISERLRLSARIDSLEVRSDGRVVIRDYKTGVTADRHGQVHDDIAKQLRLYGLIVLERLGAARIELIADDGIEHVVSFDANDIIDTRTWLLEVLERLPARASRPASSLANPGPTCVGCALRHACPAYRESAPQLWKEGTDLAAMPIDTWGVVTSFTAGDDGTLAVELEDAAARRVKMFRLNRRHEALRTAKPGDELWVFGLRGLAAQGADRRWRHPRNFWEMPSDTTQRRAWSVTVFSTATGR